MGVIYQGNSLNFEHKKLLRVIALLFVRLTAMIKSDHA